MEAVLAKAEVLGLRVFIYGGATQKLQLDFIEFINTRFPNVTVCGHYREKSASTLTLTAETVTASKADLVLVGLGCPNQELWISKQKGLINSPMLGVGAAFSFYAGHTEMAPKWMQSSGLEWFHRLMSEPRRLWFRYCFTNGFFIMLVLREYVSWVFSKLRG
jgi:N-acetylglucosaminyldiphosphoundecaprenol N-acetyl-beta-D-mannosaminyltransferase